jgi:predicted nucleic acid-binding protein
MKQMFVDTAGWTAAADEADSLHKDVCLSRDTWLESGGVLVTTDYVVDETLTLLRMRISLAAAEAWWDQIEGSSRVRIEWMHADRMERARAFFFRYRDKSFSFTDCTSFVVMKELRLRKVLTLDAHFRQAGFEAVP